MFDLIICCAADVIDKQVPAPSVTDFGRPTCKAQRQYPDLIVRSVRRFVYSIFSKTDRTGQSECASFSRRADQRNVPAHLLRKLAANGEAQAGPAKSADDGIVRLLENPEYFFL